MAPSLASRLPWPVHDRPSPNHSARNGRAVSLLVLHADAAAHLAESLGWILNPASDVSYHDLIGRTGHIYACVPWDRSAWAVGESKLADDADMANVHYYSARKKRWAWGLNSTSLSLSFSNRNDGREEYTEDQYAAGAWRAAAMMRAHPLVTLERIVTHAAVAIPAGRKTDPGKCFDMDYFKALVRRELGQ
jgi:N-acetyl-anhydromuramyl-L-alanine amidase AmpD